MFQLFYELSLHILIKSLSQYTLIKSLYSSWRGHWNVKCCWFELWNNKYICDNKKFVVAQTSSLNGWICHLNVVHLQVKSILKSYRWAPFIPVATDSSMLSVLLLLSKYRLRNVPVIETGNSSIRNFITQSAVIHGLERCNGRDWFDCISANPISKLGLPFMTPDEVR